MKNVSNSRQLAPLVQPGLCHEISADKATTRSEVPSRLGVRAPRARFPSFVDTPQALRWAARSSLAPMCRSTPSSAYRSRAEGEAEARARGSASPGFQRPSYPGRRLYSPRRGQRRILMVNDIYPRPSWSRKRQGLSEGNSSPSRHKAGKPRGGRVRRCGFDVIMFGLGGEGQPRSSTIDRSRRGECRTLERIDTPFSSPSFSSSEYRVVIKTAGRRP